MEEKLNEIQDLSQTVEDQNNNLQIYFTEANCSIDHISEKVDSMMPLPDDKVDEVEKSSSMEVKSSNEKETKTGIELETTTTGTVMVFTSLQGKDTEAAKEHESDATCTNGGVISHETSMASKKCEDSTARASSLTVNTIAKVGTEGDEPNSKQLLSKGIDDKEKDILMEYNLKLRNQNEDTEKKLKEAEANNQNGMFEIMSQLKELKESNAMKDELIRSLQEKLSLVKQV
ncbi:protein NETWORKED 2B [Gossypium hirsutum]|uniref:Protein NETWORKED 2B n=1 Tax=Gossypium hirsutum TaxID=3635 RepID=A0ABM3B9X0_GOSHI|nr:protein NETWORKED 2B-like [Gossypium hirsutum]